jgi:uncharacterized protein (TIGR02246 family)
VTGDIPLKHFGILSVTVVLAATSLHVLNVRGQEATPPGSGTVTEEQAEVVRGNSQALVEAYNRGDAKGLAALFCPQAELVDDAGNVHKGREAIAAIYSKFVERFPGAKMELNIDSLHFAAPSIAIEDGTRTVTTGDQSERATNRYTMVHVKRDEGWTIASAREFAEDPAPTPRERLEPLAWMVGDWVDEGSDVAITISCRWADSGNFLLIDFDAKVQGESVMKSNQRIGWDPLASRVRSWVFDSDGGYGEGAWTQVDESWVIKSTAVLPDGLTGSATIVIRPDGEDKFVMTGFDRILGDALESDFEAVIVRKPPQPSQ